MIIPIEAFASILAKTSNSIALLDGAGRHVRDLTREQAADWMETGKFNAFGRATRVRYLRPAGSITNKQVAGR